MRILLALLLILLAPAALADSIARHGENWVRLTAQPCTNEAVAGHLTAAGEDPADYRAASARFDGREFSACWKPDFSTRNVMMRYEDSDGGMVPFDDLKAVPEV